jgi:hypothetical protein
MTQPTLAERIAQIYELDAERTQDGWVATYAEVLCRPGRGRVSTIADCGMNAPADEANAAFIAAAPEMVQIIRELQESIGDYEDVLADKRRLTRELDIALHGETGAAKQASLCDLIHPALGLRAQADAMLAARLA